MRSSNRFGKWLFLSASFFLDGIALFLLLAVMPADTSANTLAGTTIWFDGPAEEIAIDAEITVTVSISDVLDLYGVGLFMSFPADKLQVVDADLGKAGVQSAPADCPEPDFVVDNTAENSTGSLGYGVTQFGDTPGANGNCQILHIRFRTLDGPSASLHFNWVTLSDSDGVSIEASMIDRELAVNTLPLAVDDSYTTTEGTSLTVSALEGLFSNDEDVDGDVPVIDSYTGPYTGILSLESNGSFVYTPTVDFTGPVTFTYRASDGLNLSNTALVTINVVEGDYYINLPVIIRK